MSTINHRPSQLPFDVYIDVFNQGEPLRALKTYLNDTFEVDLSDQETVLIALGIEAYGVAQGIFHPH